MFRRSVPVFAAAVFVVATAACESTKSSNPLSPTVAGPIPGVQIGAPKLLEPTAGTKIAVDRQPLTLLIENPGTTGVRPLTLTVDIATDANFNNRVFSRDGVAPGDGGRTSLKLPDALATGRTYFWRAQALDGANTGGFSTVSSFEIFTPIVINLPEPAQPGPNATVDSIRPKLVVNNATRSGPVGAISYLVELADNPNFANKISWTTAEQPNQTTLNLPADLAYSTVYYWHVRAFDPTTVGPWSQLLAFLTPAAPVVVVTPSPSPAPSGPAPGDALNLSSAGVFNSPRDIASWAVTSRITSISMSPSAGLSLEFTTKNSWPDVVPPGFTGPLQYTVWAVVNVGGQWYTSGFIQMWRGRESTGAPILSDFARNWAYDSRWGPMAGHQPQPGEQMGFFVSAGNARGEGGVSSVRERSNVVIVSLPGGDSGFFPF